MEIDIPYPGWIILTLRDIKIRADLGLKRQVLVKAVLNHISTFWTFRFGVVCLHNYL